MNLSKIKKGDTILYRFGTGMQEAKVIKVYNDKYIKIRHKGIFFDFIFKEIISIYEILAVHGE